MPRFFHQTLEKKLLGEGHRVEAVSQGRPDGHENKRKRVIISFRRAGTARLPRAVLARSPSYSSAGGMVMVREKGSGADEDTAVYPVHAAGQGEGAGF